MAWPPPVPTRYAVVIVHRGAGLRLALQDGDTIEFVDQGTSEVLFTVSGDWGIRVWQNRLDALALDALMRQRLQETIEESRPAQMAALRKPLAGPISRAQQAELRARRRARRRPTA